MKKTIHIGEVNQKRLILVEKSEKCKRVAVGALRQS